MRSVNELNQTPTSYLFDTSVLIPFLRKDSAIQQRINSVGIAYVNTIAIGEILLGAQLSKQPQQSIEQVQELASFLKILVLDVKTAEEYSNIRYDLRLRGLPIPDNDIWIAATARQYHLTLATRDAHFSNVSGLLVEQW
jgi:tRNA(fMet)-specific endonuclease VapC